LSDWDAILSATEADTGSFVGNQLDLWHLLAPPLRCLIVLKMHSGMMTLIQLPQVKQMMKEVT